MEEADRKKGENLSALEYEKVFYCMVAYHLTIHSIRGKCGQSLSRNEKNNKKTKEKMNKNRNKS